MLFLLSHSELRHERHYNRSSLRSFSSGKRPHFNSLAEVDELQVGDARFKEFGIFAYCESEYANRLWKLTTESSRNLLFEIPIQSAHGGCENQVSFQCF